MNKRSSGGQAETEEEKYIFNELKLIKNALNFVTSVNTVTTRDKKIERERQKCNKMKYLSRAVVGVAAVNKSDD